MTENRTQYWPFVSTTNTWLSRSSSTPAPGSRSCHFTPQGYHLLITYCKQPQPRAPAATTGERGCATKKWRSSRRAARLPVVLEAVVDVAASQGNDGVGSADRPEHAGLFETRADYGLAAGFDDTRADEQMLCAEFGIAHALGIFLKVVGLNADLFRQLRIGRNDGTKRGHQIFNLPLIQQRVLMDNHPAFLLSLLVGKQFLEGYPHASFPSPGPARTPATWPWQPSYSSGRNR